MTTRKKATKKGHKRTRKPLGATETALKTAKAKLTLENAKKAGIKILCVTGGFVGGTALAKLADKVMPVAEALD